jgi:hypothetical protein
MMRTSWIVGRVDVVVGVGSGWSMVGMIDRVVGYHSVSFLVSARYVAVEAMEDDSDVYS